MQPKRHTYTHLHPELLRWLGYVGLLLFVPGGIPLALVLFVRQHGHRFGVSRLRALIVDFRATRLVK